MKSDTDEGWNELARELGLEQPSRPPIPAEPDDDATEDLDSDFAPGAEAEPEYEADSDLDSETDSDSEDGDADADGDGSGDNEATQSGDPGPDGPKKKRRRRRRRRRKGGEIGEAPTAEGQDSTEEGENEEIEDATSDDGEYEDEPAAETEVDGPSAEAARELIANWDVPSWEQIVMGLYRPGR